MEVAAVPSSQNWIFITPAVANMTPINAVTALAHLFSGGIIKSINRMPIANSASNVMGSAMT